jgi:hypothetical protein
MPSSSGLAHTWARSQNWSLSSTAMTWSRSASLSAPGAGRIGGLAVDHHQNLALCGP